MKFTAAFLAAFAITCDAFDCTAPDPADVKVVITPTVTTSTGFDVTVVCAPGYQTADGIVLTAEACTADAAYTIAESCDECAENFYVDLTTGSPVCSSCTDGATSNAAGDLLTDGVSTCDDFVCTRPTDDSIDFTTGEENIDLKTGVFDVSLTCATGYELIKAGTPATPTATACSSAGDYTVESCTPIECITPDPANPDVTLSEYDTTSPGFNVTVACAPGYQLGGGTVPTAVKCTTAVKYTTTGTCNDCALNYYVDDGDDKLCVACPDGSTIPAGEVRASSAKTCDACFDFTDELSLMSGSNTSCTGCTGTAQTECTTYSNKECATGYQNFSASTGTCNECAINYYGDSGNCTVCPEGETRIPGFTSYSNSTDGNTCYICAKDYDGSVNENCTKCSPGLKLAAGTPKNESRTCKSTYDSSSVSVLPSVFALVGVAMYMV